MIYTLENSLLRVSISSIGAEMKSIQKSDDLTEYLWQGDPAIWDESAPNLFPICGRLKEGKYTWKGNEYRMSLHGFLRTLCFDAEQPSSTCLRLTVCDSEETRKQYPFSFRYELTYRLEENRITMNYSIVNTNPDEVLPFSFGAHPGFRIPLEDGLSFHDYFLEFPAPCSPQKLIFTSGGLCSGNTEPFALENQAVLRLSHALFDEESSIFLHGVPDQVMLKSNTGKRGVTLIYPGMRYLGLWQMPNIKASYLCIEPWHGSPSGFDAVDDFATKKDMIRLPAGQTYRAAITLCID